MNIPRDKLAERMKIMKIARQAREEREDREDRESSSREIYKRITFSLIDTKNIVGIKELALAY